MGRFRFKLGALLVVAIVCLCQVSSAQQVFGSIYGTVVDATGAAVNNAKVTITDISKGTSFEVNTNESGTYQKNQLIPDQYTVSIQAPGFQKVLSSPVTVAVDQASRFDASLQVGNIEQQIEVTAAAPLLQTDRSDVAQTFTAKELAVLPNIGRNVQSFELLNPGTVKIGWQHASSENPQGSVQTMVNGQLFSATGYELDGTTNQDPILGIIVVNPTMDSVNEVKQANQDYDAEFEYMGGGLMTYSTKSGANQFHGDAFEYLFINTPGFQDFARNPFNSAENNGTPTVHQNQFGGSIGGRIIKDKLFFFGDAQLNREHIGSSLITTVPTAAERAGDLSDWLAAGAGTSGPNPYIAYDPASAAGAGTRTPFAYNGRLNVIDPARISPQAQQLLSYFPLPNTVEQNTGFAFRNNYSTTGTDIIASEQWNTRWDYFMNERNSFFGRYSYASYGQDAPPAFGFAAGGPNFPSFGFAGHSNALNQSIAAGYTHTFSPTLINEFRFGYMRYHVVVTPGGLGTSPANDAGIPGLNLDSFYTSGMPNFYIHEPGGADNGLNGTSQIGYALNNNRCNCPLTELERQYQFVDNITKMVGNHNIKFGADMRYAQNLRVPSDSHRSGELEFQPEYTGQVNGDAATGGLGIATFLLGEVTTFNRYVSSTTNAQERQGRFFFYGQDQWHATPKLTLTYGLRWEAITPESVNNGGNGAALNLATGNIEVFGEGNVSLHGYQTFNPREFAPRVGFAYQLTKKSVVRAGYGWSYNLGTFGSTFGHNVTQNPPILSHQNINRPNNFSGVFTLAEGPPLPEATPVPVTGMFPLPDQVNAKARPGEFTMPVVYTYNAMFEQQLTQKISVQAGYVGNQTRHGTLGTSIAFNANEPSFIPGNTNVNLARPYYAKYGWTQNIDYYCNCANERYDSFQALVKVNGWSGYTVNANYTYQVSQGDGWGSDNSYTFLYDRPLGWGNADFIPHNQWTIAQNYEIPFGRGRRWGNQSSRLLDWTLGGWTISGITQYFSGIPFNPTVGTYPSDYVRPNAGPNDRPDKGSGDPYSGARQDRTQWFVGGFGGAFAVPQSNTFGNYPINELYGPHFINQDVSLMKSFSLSERWRFTLRADATNAFNHTNLGTPNNNITDAAAGQITQTAFGGNYQMRRMQFSGTINW